MQTLKMNPPMSKTKADLISIADNEFADDQIKVLKKTNRTINLISFAVIFMVYLYIYYLYSHVNKDQVQIKFCTYAKFFSELVLCFSVFIYLTFFVFNFNETYSYELAVINNVLIDVPFILISGLLRSFYGLPADALMIILSIEIFLRVYLSYIINNHFKICLHYSLIIFIYNIIVFYSSHQKIPAPVINYMITKVILLILLNYFTYVVEQKFKKDYINKLKKKEEQMYYIDILDSMNVGLFAYKSKKMMYK